MKTLRLLVLLWLLLNIPVLGESEPFIVTDLLGSPRYSLSGDFKDEEAFSLLGGARACRVRLREGHKLTLTKLSDGSRICIIGPSEGRLTTQGFSPEPEFKDSVRIVGGRAPSQSELRNVSSTLGAGLVRTNEVKGVLLASKGKLLRPELFWLLLDRNYIASDVTVADQDGQNLEEWKKLSTNTLDLSSLNLQPGAIYTVRLTPLEKYLEGPTEKTQIVLASEELVAEAESQRKLAWDEYRKDPSDLSPLTVYLAFLIEHQLLCEAYRLTRTEEFAEQKVVKKKLEVMLMKHP